MTNKMSTSTSTPTSSDAKREVHVQANVTRFTGFADLYDQVRPKPPQLIVPMLCQLAGVDRPARVADVGCGTGLSTLLWADKCDSIVGVEPSGDMRKIGEQGASSLKSSATVFEFKEGFSHDTGLPSNSCDIVTVSQALHWMEPEPTFKEIARILRPGGVFAAFDCDWPPTLHWRAEQAWNTIMDNVTTLEKKHGISKDVKKWNKDEHLGRIVASGQFQYVREMCLHNVETGTADRLVRLATSQGGLATLLKEGISAEEIGVPQMRKEVEAAIGATGEVDWYWTYRVRLGIK